MPNPSVLLVHTTAVAQAHGLGRPSHYQGERERCEPDSSRLAKMGCCALLWKNDMPKKSLKVDRKKFEGIVKNLLQADPVKREDVKVSKRKPGKLIPPQK